MRSIFLSAGHSNADPGACAFGRTEAGIVTEVRNMVAFYLQRAGAAVAMDGDGLVNLPLNKAAAMAAKYAIALEFHCNAAAAPVQVPGKPPKPPAAGVETLSGPDDMQLGADLCKAIAGVLGTKIRGAKPENAGQHHRLAFVQAGGVIVELFFITNPDELKAYDEKKWLVAKAIADVILHHARKL